MFSSPQTPLEGRTIRLLLFAWLLCSSALHAQSIRIIPGATVSTSQAANKPGILVFTFPKADWYLISVPLEVDDNSVNTLFPIALNAFTWENNQYVSVSTMQSDRGYWLLIPAPSTAVISGNPITKISGHFLPGWQLIGSVLDTVDFSNPNDTPDGSILLPLFRWHGERQRYYPTANKIELGHGYWMAVLQESEVVIESNAPNMATKSADVLAIKTFYEQFGAEPPPPPFCLTQSSTGSLPKQSALSDNYPNPFNPETVIKYAIAEKGMVHLYVYNRLGQIIRTLTERDHQPGTYQIVWDGCDESGRQVGSGVYLYRIITMNFSETKKMALVR